MASNLDREILSDLKCINLVFIRVSGVFRSSTSFPCLEGFSAPLGARKCLSPTKRIKEIFEQGKSPRSYDKARDALKILEQNNLMISVQACPELKAFINTILALCEGELIP